MRARSLVVLREEVVDVRAFERQEVSAVDASAVILGRRESGAELRRGLDLRGHAADGEDLSADTQGTGHRNGLVDRYLFQGADDGRRHRDGCAVAFGAFPGADELDMDVVVRDVFARVLLDQRGDILDGLLRDFSEAARRDNAASLFRLSGSDFRGDRQHDATKLRDRVVADQDREAIDHANDSAFRDERLILLAPLDHPVRDLLFERPRDPLRVHDVLRRDERRRLFLRDVARHSDETTELAQSQRQLTAAAGPPLRLPQDLEDRGAIEVRNLPVFCHLLGDEQNELEPILFRIGHRALHVNLVTVPADPRAQRRMHPLYRVEVPGGDEDKVAWNGFGLDHGPGGPLALADDREFLLLHRRQEALLALHPEHVDLVDEQDALVGLVNRARLDALMRGRLEPAALERIVLHVPEECTRMAARRIDERGHLVGPG